MRKASYTAPRPHDDIDNVLAENGVGTEASSSQGLDNIIGRKHHRAAKHAKKRARR
jgi:hypothetical protein